MTAIDITLAERQTGRLDPAHLVKATRAMKEDGYVILNEAVEREHADILCKKMLEDVQTILSRDDVPFNFNTGNVQQDPPPFPPYLFKDVLLNDLVIAVSQTILGPGLKNAFYSGNTVLPKQGGRQPVHADIGQLWPNLETATPPFALVVNVLPMDVSPHNGSTEIWPGTHTDPTIYWQSGDLKVPADRLEARRAIAPPFQPTAKAGSVVIRDIRLWHAGMPNHSDTPRPMIAMIHYVGWWNDASPLEFPAGTEEFFQHPILATPARFVDGPIDYLHRHQSFDLQK
jgi:ectoine hydroxylase-related dioxygenase (phytanoyl-CoA dioxygenase family)